MMDQAQKLRKIIDGNEIKNIIENIMPKQSENIIKAESLIATCNARVITITSGKGGVGKRILQLILPLRWLSPVLRVVILDADFGFANIEVVMGSIPKYNLLDVVKNRKTLTEVISEGPNNIRFISGGSGVEEIGKINVC